MDKLSKDVLSIIAMKLSFTDLIRWCISSKKIYSNIYNNDNFWINKLKSENLSLEKFISDSFSILSLSHRDRYFFIHKLVLALTILKKKKNSNNIYKIFLRKKLDLAGKSITQIPDFHLPNVEVIHLNWNFLKKIPKLNLPHLQKLDLSRNFLAEIPALNSPNLKELSLYGNFLKKIPELNLPNLQKLDLRHNKLVEIPTLNLPNLQELSLSYNNLEKFSGLSFPNLQKLFLNNNLLTQISDLNFPNLIFLGLNDNLLTELQLNFSVEIFDIKNNRLEKFPQLNFSKLVRINLANNKLKEISNMHIPYLKNLNLENNNLEKITHLSLPSIEYLRLNNNRLLSEISSLYVPKIIKFYTGKKELARKYRNKILRNRKVLD